MSDHSANFVDIAGAQYGDVTVLDFLGTTHGHAIWACRCACGVEFEEQSGNLRSGKVRRCLKCRLRLQPLRAKLMNGARLIARAKRRAHV